MLCMNFSLGNGFFNRCLTPDAETRPDIVEVSSMISDAMMKYLDDLSTSHFALEKKLERERRRTQRYFMEANRNAVTCHHQLAISSHVSTWVRVFFLLLLLLLLLFYHTVLCVYILWTNKIYAFLNCLISLLSYKN